MKSHLAWGILGTGSIAHTFAKALRQSQTGKLVAIGSRSQESADKFGDEFDVPHRHASYEAMLANPAVESLYISTPHPYHAEWTIKAAQAGKGILCEKPLALNAPEAMMMVEAARDNGVFLMEAFMYRCHPQTQKVVELIQDGAIGDVRLIQANFSFQGNYKSEARHVNPELGGGGILDVGCYCASMARLVAGAAVGKPFAEPTQIFGAGHLGATGVDEWAAATLLFPGDIVAQLACGVSLSTENTVRIWGSKGHIIIPSPWFCGPTDGQIKILLQGEGEKTPREVVIESEASLYAIEADTVARFWEQKEATSPAMSLDDTLGNMQLLDKWRERIGLTYPDEKSTVARPTLDRQPLRARADHPMKYGRIKGVDKPISRLVMGTMLEGATFQWPHVCALFDHWLEQGGTCFDTAYIYSHGKSESLLGQWMKNRGCREDVVIIGKGAHPPSCTPAGMTRELLETLERLQTDYVDIYMMHRDNLEVPIGEWVDVLNEHARAGRMRVFGGSNWSLERVQQANDYATAKKLQGFSTISNNFSLARMVQPVWDGCISSSDPESKAWLQQAQLPLFSWSSQARGFFVRGDRNFTGDKELTRIWYSDDNFERLERARQLAQQKNTSPINIAAAYVLNQTFPTYALIGPRALSETRTSLPALNIQLSPQEVSWLNLES